MDWPIFIIITDPLRVTTELQFVERYPHLFLNLMFFCIFKYLSLKSVFQWLRAYSKCKFKSYT